MNFNNLKDNTLLIVPNKLKNLIIEEISKLPLKNIKIMSIEELKKKYIFDYDDEAIYFLMKKYKIKYDVALTYIQNMYYIEKDEYNSKKLQKLLNFKNELLENNLLIKDDLFRYYLNKNKIVVYGYDYIDKFSKKMLKEISKITDVEIIYKENKLNKKFVINEFDNIDNEINYVINQIIDLLNKDININNIKLAGVTSEYEIPLKRMFEFYNIPLKLDTDTSLFDTYLGNMFLNLCKTNETITDVINIFKNEINNDEIYNKIINVCNKINFNKLDDINIKIIENKLKQTKIVQNHLNNCVEIIDLKDNIINDNLYVFLMGFNQGSIPITYKDEDFFGDNLKNVINVETTLEKNINEKKIILNILNNIQNLTITYKLKTPFDTYYPSILINDMDVIIKRPTNDLKVTYSDIYNKLNLTKLLDKLIKFGKIDENLPILYNSYKDVKYLKYDNTFNKIDSENLKNFINNKLLLSYSSIDKFFRCKFRYYIGNILKLEKYEETFPIFIGSMFHYILSICFEEGFNFEKAWEDYLKDKELSNKEKFFLGKLKDELSFIIDTLNYQRKFSNFKKALYEKKIYINKDRNIKITFMGIVDKILYEEKDGQTLVAIIDYKTGYPETNLNNTIYGIEMQLPVYLYLVKNSNLFTNIKFAGFYLQKILNNEVLIKVGDDIEKIKRDSLKLSGYSTSNEDILKEFDFSYVDSEVIKSMKMGKNGFYSYSKVIDDDKINKLIELVDKKIDEASKEILEGDFTINPKRIGLKNIGCEFCNFKDLCFMNEKNIVNLKEYKNLEFLENKD